MFAHMRVPCSQVMLCKYCMTATMHDWPVLQLQLLIMDHDDITFSKVEH